MEQKSLIQNSHISFFCDNMSVVWAFKQLGCRNPQLNTIVREIIEKLSDLNATYTVTWISTHYQLADSPSRKILWNEERDIEICSGICIVNENIWTTD